MKIELIMLHKIHLAAVAVLGFACTQLVSAQTIGEAGKPQVTVIKPKKEVGEVKSSSIDTEKFELGVYVGLMSLEDFDTVSLVGLSGSYHVNAKWVASLAFGKSSGPEASFEEVLGQNFVADRDSGFQYLAAFVSYELAEGRSFYGENTKLSSHVYVDFGVEQVDFLGESEVGVLIGLNYKVVFTDWLTGNLIFRDHIVEREFLGENKLTQNLEAAFGVSALF